MNSVCEIFSLLSQRKKEINTFPSLFKSNSSKISLHTSSLITSSPINSTNSSFVMKPFPSFQFSLGRKNLRNYTMSKSLKACSTLLFASSFSRLVEATKNS